MVETESLCCKMQDIGRHRYSNEEWGPNHQFWPDTKMRNDHMSISTNQDQAPSFEQPPFAKTVFLLSHPLPSYQVPEGTDDAAPAVVPGGHHQPQHHRV